MLKKLFIFAFVLLFTGLSLLLNENPKHLPEKIVALLLSPTPKILGEKIQPTITLPPEFAVVKRVIDGDTIELTDGRKLRYIGINAPETVDPRRGVQCFGKEASEENKKILQGATIRLEKDISETDKFGRLLRYVYFPLSGIKGEVFINEYLVKEGYAYASSYPPDVKYQEILRAAERVARENKKGLWGNCQN